MKHQQDRVIFQKISPTTHVMSLFQGDTLVYKQQLSTKDYFKHDLLHMALHLYIFGNVFDPEAEKMDMEIITGALHNIYQQELNFDEYIAQLKLYFKGIHKRFPKYINMDFLKKLRAYVIRHFSDYKKIPSGKSLEIILKV